MIRPFFSVALVSMALAAVACGGTDDPQPSSSTSSNSPDDGDTQDSQGSSDTPEGSDEGDDSSESSVGPQCEAYFACCKEIADEHPEVAASCDQTKSQIDAAEEKGASTSSYESACESALDAAKSAAYCD